MKQLFTIFFAALMLASCAEFTEIQPKGKNILSSTTEIDMLLNYDYSPYQNYGFQCSNYYSVLVNDIIPTDNIINLAEGPYASVSKAIFTYDDSIDRKSLTRSDETYADLYKVVGRMCNPIISLVDQATGSESLKRQYKAEALAMRAYVHYLLVNLYAAAYDPVTATSTSGIYYLLETAEPSDVITQWTVGQVYDQILADVNAALELNALPDRGDNAFRASKAFAYAVKAQVLMNMKDFTGAEAAAKASIAANGYIEDYNVYKGGFWSHPNLGSVQDLFFFPGPAYLVLPSDEMNACFEEGDILSTHIMLDEMVYGFHFSEMYCGADLGPMWFDMDSYMNEMGITTAQMYLTAAECAIRRGAIDEGLAYVDAVRACRIDSDIYQPIAGTITDKAAAFAAMKRTLRTENICSIWNFIDFKRWNVEPEYRQVIVRKIDAVSMEIDYETFEINMKEIHYSFTLKPESNLWLRPFPVDALTLNSELQQNY